MRPSPPLTDRFILTLQHLVVVLTVCFTGCHHSGDSLSFTEFERCQQEYCWQVAEFLNTPIDWHIVLDVSGSYLENGDPITEKLLLLIRSLPLQEGDSLTIDGFSEDYYEGDKHQDVSSEWIQRVKGERGDLIVKSDVEHLFTRLDDKPPFPRETTDIAGLFTGPRPRLSSHTPHMSLKSRLYYVVLTDGAHDPTGKRTPVPLFNSPQKTSPQFTGPRGQPTTFLQALMAFVGEPEERYFRALFLIIDPKPMDWRKGADPVRRDWDLGIRQIAELKTKGKARLLNAAFWNSGGDPFSAPARRQVGRLGGVYPCLVTVTQKPSGPWPTVTGLPYPHLAKCSSNNPYKLEIPSDLANGQKESVELPLILLSSESRKRDLLVTFRAGKGRTTPGEDIRRTESFESVRDDAYSGWKPVIHSTQVPSFEDDSNFQFPWLVEFSFHGQPEQSPFFKVWLLEPATRYSLVDGMRHRGKALIFGAFLSWAFSLLCAWLYIETVRMKVKVEIKATNGMSLTVETDKSKPGRKQRVRHFAPAQSPLLLTGFQASPRDGKLEIMDVDREDLPDPAQVNRDYIVLDIIPILSVVYHLIYVNPDLEKHIRDLGRYEIVTFNGAEDKVSFRGGFLQPTTFWNPRPSDLRLGAWLGPWQKCDHIWGQEVPMPADRNYSVTTEIGETWTTFLWRVISVVLSSCAVGLSVAGIRSSLSRSQLDLFMTFIVSCFVALVAYTSLYWPQRSSPRRWRLWADSFFTFLLLTVLIMGVFVSVFATTSVNRLVFIVVSLIACLFVASLYEKLRDRLVSSRLKNRQPVNKWDFLLEFFLAKLCSW